MRHVIGAAVITWAATHQNSGLDLLVGLGLFLMFALGEYVAIWYTPKSWEIEGKKDEELSLWATNKSGLNVIVKEVESEIANAFAWKDWKTIQVVFTKSIKNLVTTDELKAVIGHELGHIERRHPGRLMLNSAIVDVIGIIAGWYFVRWWSLTMPEFNPAEIDSTFWIWIAPWAILILVFMASREWVYYLRRQYEYEADKVAAQHTNSKAMAKALTALHPAEINIVSGQQWRMTHPLISDRIKVLNTLN